jgi:hypothetical protein
MQGQVADGYWYREFVQLGKPWRDPAAAVCPAINWRDSYDRGRADEVHN